MFSVHWSPCFQAIPLSTLIPGERTWFIGWITLLKKFSENRQFLWHTLVDIVIHTTILQDINTVWIVIDWKLQGPRRTCEIWQLLPSGTLHSWFVTSTPFLICPNMADCKPYRIQLNLGFQMFNSDLYSTDSLGFSSSLYPPKHFDTGTCGGKIVKKMMISRISSSTPRFAW